MSDAGYPKSVTHSYSYPSSFTDFFGNVFPGSNDGSSQVQVEDKSGVDTPGWPHAIRTNPYTRWTFSLPETSMHYSFSGTGQLAASGGDSIMHKYLNGSVDTLAASIWPHIVDAYSDCRYKIVNRLIDQIRNSKTNAAQFVVERQQTARLVASTARRLADAMHNLRSGNLVGASNALLGSKRNSAGRIARAAGGIPEQWLALQYGWKPLLSDVYGSCEELANLMNAGEPPVLSARSSGGAQSDVQADFSLGNSPDFRYKGKVVARGTAFIETRLSASLGQILGRTGITNPYNLAWEELPYSFVVDWFLPVGNFLSRLDYESGLIFSRGYISMSIEGEIIGSMSGGESRFPPGFTSGFWTAGNSTCHVRYFQREALSSFPMPQAPRFKDPFSPTHVANALSLLATAFQGARSVR